MARKRRLRRDRGRALIKRDRRGATCRARSCRSDLIGAHAHVRRKLPTTTIGPVVALPSPLRVHARRRARIIRVRAAAEFVAHVVDRGESYTHRRPVALIDAVG